MLLAENSCRLSQEAIDELKVKLKSEVSEYNISHPTLHINLYDVSYYTCKIGPLQDQVTVEPLCKDRWVLCPF